MYIDTSKICVECLDPDVQGLYLICVYTYIASYKYTYTFSVLCCTPRQWDATSNIFSVESDICTYVLSEYIRFALCCTLNESILFFVAFILQARVPLFRIRDCAKGCNNRAQMCAQLSATDVTARTFFKCLY